MRQKTAQPVADGEARRIEVGLRFLHGFDCENAKAGRLTVPKAVLKSMTRTVLCRKYGRELEGLDAPPMPGPLGETLYSTVSKAAWNAWLKHQTTLINEKFLNLRDASARTYLSEQMERFLDNEAVDIAEGYEAPEAGR